MGGVKFFVHIGVLKALEEADIEIDYLSGTSSGAFLAGLYALWGDISRIEEFSLNVDFVKYFKFLEDSINLRNIENTPFIVFYTERSGNKIKPKWLKGLVDVKSIRDEIDLLTNRASFEYDLKIPFAAVATDLLTGEKIVISHGRISNAIAASMAQPGTCIPFEFENRTLMDGGLVDPVPSDIAREMGADIVIGVSLKRIEWDTDPVMNNILSILQRSIFIMNDELHSVSSDEADIFIEPQFKGNVGYFMNRKEREKLIKIGEEEAIKIIPRLKSLIDSY